MSAATPTVIELEEILYVVMFMTRARLVIISCCEFLFCTSVVGFLVGILKGRWEGRELGWREGCVVGLDCGCILGLLDGFRIG